MKQITKVVIHYDDDSFMAVSPDQLNFGSVAGGGAKQARLPDDFLSVNIPDSPTLCFTCNTYKRPSALCMRIDCPKAIRGSTGLTP